MSMEQTSVVDAIGIDKKTNDVMLTITDHLEWDPANEHLLILQAKLNSYLAFIESGEVYDAYPKAHGKKIMISIVALHPPIGTAIDFLERAKATITSAGFGFRFECKDGSFEIK